MRKPKQEKTAWTISRTMPPELFYRAIASLYSGHRSVSSTARMLLRQRDRGGLQSATFHTLRTYLTPLHKLLKSWLKSFPNVGPLPCILQEAVDWLKDNKSEGTLFGTPVGPTPSPAWRTATENRRS
jgi:hypothetical protein